jgi:hypothetical protein
VSLTCFQLLIELDPAMPPDARPDDIKEITIIIPCCSVGLDVQTDPTSLENDLSDIDDDIEIDELNVKRNT